MSKDTSRKRDRNEVQHLKGEIRELEKTVRSLQKMLRYYEKRSVASEPEEIKPFDAPNTPPPKPITCVLCGKGHYNVFEVLGRVYGTCNIEACGHREKLK